MSYLVEYKDGVLTIPLDTLKNYLGATGDIRNHLRDSEEISSADDFIYDKSDYYLPFRLLDGEFIPYIEQCIGGIKPCENLKEGDYLMKTMVGTIEIEKNINPRMIPLKFYSSRQYNLNSLNGIQKRKVVKEIGNFPKIFWESLVKEKDINIPMTETVYKLISITSDSVANAKKDFVPMRIVIPEEYLNYGVNKLKKDSHCLDEVGSYCTSNGYLSVIYEVTEEVHLCTTSIARILLKQDNNHHGEKRIFDIIVSNDSAKEVVDYLSNPSSEINYKINDISNIEFYIKVDLSMEFSNLLLNSLDIEGDQRQSIEITLDKKSFPITNEVLINLMQVAADGIIDQYGDSSPEGIAVMSGCALCLEYIGYVSTE